MYLAPLSINLDDQRVSLERPGVQDCQPERHGCARVWRLLPPAAEGARRIQTHSDGDGFRGNAHKQVGRELLLEFRRSVPAAEPPRQVRHTAAVFRYICAAYNNVCLPCRDAHDTFFIKSPAAANIDEEDYYETVKDTHENGGFGSIGYGCNFKREEATKNILRTHTTAISAQMLYKLAKETKESGVFKPKKYFSVDRVFRNEAMDATHLCEFHQVEGLVADRNLTLGNLLGTIRTFFEKIGITQLRFKPAYNPYTEPSMEIFGYHPELKKWTEIGNSGMFRPEMLRPMGLPEDVRVIAWGLSLERPTMIKYRIENIRDLFGHKADISRQRTAPIARFF